MNNITTSFTTDCYLLVYIANVMHISGNFGEDVADKLHSVTGVT